MKIKFLQDFRGRETNEQFFERGQVAEFEDGVASRLVADGRAEFVPVVVEVAPVEVVTETVEETEAPKRKRK